MLGPEALLLYRNLAEAVRVDLIHARDADLLVFHVPACAEGPRFYLELHVQTFYYN
jgi:hypothetical protein